MGYMRRLTSYALKHKKLFYGFMTFAGIGQVFNILTPLVLANIIDEVIYGGLHDLLVPQVLLYFTLAAFYMLFDIAGRYGAAILAQNVIYDVRKDLYDALMEKDLAFYDKEETGQLLARVTTDVTMLREWNYWGYRIVFIGIVMTIGVYLAMYSLSPLLTTYMLLIIPIMLFFIYSFAKKVRPVFYKARDQYGALSSVLAENIVGMKVIKSYAAGKRETKRVEEENRNFTDTRIEAFRLFAFYRPLLPTLFGLITGLLIYVGGYSYILGDLSYGTFVGFVILMGMLMLPARFLSWSVGMYQRASASSERAFYIIDHKDQVMTPENPIEHDIKGKVTFEHVYFSYQDGDYILRDINMEINPGQVVALLGGTGSGKTSLINLIPRFYDADLNQLVEIDGISHKINKDGKIQIDDTEYNLEDGKVRVGEEEFIALSPGKVYIDDVPIEYFSIENLRADIGMVHQDPFLFSSSIKDNIAFAKPDSEMVDIIAAAKAANIHNFIETLELGYDTLLGERGMTLSGGQKQRIAIARALVADPTILILDDSTSSVDAKTENLIQQALDTLMKNRTTFIITHRLNTVKNADIIVMMEKGRIMEIGSHQELLNRGGLYASIHETLEEMERAAGAPSGGIPNE
ncbi:MAG: ABC transporter transmembrane domain-containing protein [Candidatus Thorarchaeota archaeon]